MVSCLVIFDIPNSMYGHCLLETCSVHHENVHLQAMIFFFKISMYLFLFMVPSTVVIINLHFPMLFVLLTLNISKASLKCLIFYNIDNCLLKKPTV